MRATALSNDKARAELGYEPRPVGPALQETITYLLETCGDRTQV